MPLGMDVQESFRGDWPEKSTNNFDHQECNNDCMYAAANTVNKTMEKKCLLSKGFVYEVHAVDFYNTFIFMK